MILKSILVTTLLATVLGCRSVTPSRSEIVFNQQRGATLAGCRSDTASQVRVTEYTYKRFDSKPLGGRFALRAYVFRSELARPTVVALFHGGAWTYGGPTDDFELARRLASNGWVVAVFQYRTKSVFLSTPEESVADAVSAIRWLRKYAGELNLSGARIVAMGDSAGGQLALTLNLLGERSSIANDPPDALPFSTAATIALYPVVDLAQLARWSYADVGLEHPEISPQQLLSKVNLPPATLILHGSKDLHSWTSYVKAQSFCDSVNQLAGDSRCQFKIYPERKHAFLSQPADAELALMDVEQYLSEGTVSPQLSARPQSTTSACPFTDERAEALKSEWGYATPVSSRWAD